MDAKLKAAVLLVLVGGGGFIGWRFLQDKAANASDEDLFTNYVLAPGAGVSPYNAEAQKRVEAATIKWGFLTSKAMDKDDKVKQIAFNLMAYVPKTSRDEVVKFVESNWGKYAVTEVREQMVFAIKECALNGMGDKGKGVIRFLATTSWDPGKKHGVSPETEKVIAKALRELADQAGDTQGVVHDREGWVKWYGLLGGNAKTIPEEVSNKRGKNK